MLSYSQALGVLRERIVPIRKMVRLPLEESMGHALAEPIIAPEPNPRFDNSAVDGYAIGSVEDSTEGMSLEIQGHIAAGGVFREAIRPHSVVRILTGAPVPAGTYGIAMQEDVVLDGNSVILRQSVPNRQFIRRQGSDFQAGEVLAPAGTVVDAGVSAQLAFVGVVRPSVFRQPLVSILTTGDEIVDPSQIPGPSQIRDTNSVMLQMQVLQTCGACPTVIRVADDRELFKETLSRTAGRSDLVIISGGASVGDKDFLDGIMRELGTVHFHGVSIRPGKPILFGQIGSCFVFGLPGNPASAYVCFEIFVREAIRRLAGWLTPEPRWVDCTIGFDHKACGREDFVRIRRDGPRVVEMGQQGSFGINSLATAHGLLMLSATEDRLVGSQERVLWLG